MNTDEPQPYTLFITSRRKLKESDLIFGTYSEVTIDTLKNIQLKYIDSCESLISYLIDFHLLENRPKVIVIDGLELYCSGSEERKMSQVNTSNKKLKVDYI